MIFCSDDFDGGTGGTTLAGRVSSGGQTWSANLDLGHSGQALLYPLTASSTKLGSKNSTPDSSALYYLDGSPPSADYGVNFSFEFGTTLVFDSIGVLLRFQETTPTATPHFYMIWYNGAASKWQMWYNDGAGVLLLGQFSRSYSPGVVPFTFRACGTTIELLESGTSILSVTDSHIAGAGHAGVIVPSCNSSFTDAAGWWITNFEADSSACAVPQNFVTRGYGVSGARAVMHQRGPGLNLYFAGSGTPGGEDFTPVDYGIPTLVEIDNPVAGTEYAIPVTPVDLAGFTPGKMGNVKLRRDSDAPIANTTDVVFRAMSIRYRKA